MPQSLPSVLIHLIFSTKNREPYLTTAVEPELHPYMATIFRGLNCPSLAINGATDHVHSLFSLARTVTIADVVEESKPRPRNGLRQKAGSFKTFTGSGGMAPFQSVNQKIADVKRYIERQKEHHRRVTFQEEYRRFLKSYGIDYDERYVWD